MSEQNSILDKIIQSKQIQEATQFDPAEIIANLFKNLSSKERDILSRRFGLSGKEKETLEQIGKNYQITRERIRQIETGAIKKLKELKNFKEQIKVAEHNLFRLLESHGGIMEENHLLENLLSYVEANKANRQASLFIISKLLKEKINQIKTDQDIYPSWKTPSFSTNLLKQILNELVEIIKQEDNLLTTKDLLSKFKEQESFDKYHKQIIKPELINQDTETDTDKILNSYLIASKKINQNILDEWGLTHWHTVSPKRMGDKVYLILRKLEKPLHFNEITDLINQSDFDKKVAYPATIHNELILDDRYILVGRGIYALKEWGYQSGTVIDIVLDILAKSPTPLSRDEIIKKVLDQRMVRKSTILLALTNKEKIKRSADGTYTLNK